MNPAIGPQVDPSPAPPPRRVVLEGSRISLVPLATGAHSADLWTATGGAENSALWTYLSAGPFPDRASFDAYLESKAASEDPLCYAIVGKSSGRALGHVALMRIDTANRVIEAGHVLYGASLQKTPAATEVLYLLARYVFEVLGYRRFEWKCDSLNAPSRRAARRYGFTFEGIFRQHGIVKGRNRDTVWFSMLDTEWPSRKLEYERWLADSNFDEEGRQRTPLRVSPLSPETNATPE